MVARASTDSSSLRSSSRLSFLGVRRRDGRLNDLLNQNPRWLVVLKAFRRDLFTAIHPEVIRLVHLSGSPVNEDTIRDIYTYTLVSIVIFSLLTVFAIVDATRANLALSEFEAMGAAASTFLNIGPAFGFAGPYGSYWVFLFRRSSSWRF